MSAVAEAERRIPAEWERLPAHVLDELPTLAELLDNPVPDAVWTPMAACLGMDQAVFYPEGYGQGSRTAEARMKCRGCPVRRECLVDALRTEPRAHRNGVWGGLSCAQRDAVAAALDAQVDPAELAEECPAGHPWENVARIRPDGSRECRVCWPRGRRTAGGAR